MSNKNTGHCFGCKHLRTLTAQKILKDFKCNALNKILIIYDSKDGISIEKSKNCPGKDSI